MSTETIGGGIFSHELEERIKDLNSRALGEKLQGAQELPQSEADRIFNELKTAGITKISHER